MSDPFITYLASISGPATSAIAITPSDTNALATVSRAIWVGGAGDIAVILGSDSAAVTISSISAGSLLPLRVKQVLAAGTTATSLVALS